MAKSKVRNKVLHVYMTAEEYAFLQTCADKLGMSIAQTMLHLADFENRRREYEQEQNVQGLAGINFTQLPDREEGDY